MNTKKSIIMIGPIPPPIGGVSIHISRLISMLENIHDIYIIDTSKNKLVLLLRLFKLFFLSLFKPSHFIVHNHIFKLEFNVIIIIVCKILRVRYIQTIHSLRLDKKELGIRKLSLIKFIIKNSDNIIVVNKKIRDDLMQYNQSALQKILVLPAFIPYEKESTKINGDYLKSLQIEEFMTSHEILLCANAFKIVFHNNEDLYGIDLCIELMKKIKSSKGHKVGFIFMLPQIGDLEYFNMMKKRVIEYGIEKDFVFINKEVDLVPLFEYIDIFLRPTNTDGDSLSIREAIYSGIPTIASDIVERPFGTITFKNRVVSDLFEKVLGVIENINDEKSKAQNLAYAQEDLVKKYYLIYK